MKTGMLPVRHTHGDTPWWSPAEAYQWALAHPRLRLSGRVPLRHWPAASSPTQYLGAVDLDEAVATRWRATAGIVSVLWPLADGVQHSLKDWAAEVSPGGDGAVILVTSMFFRGPDIDGFLPGKPDDGEYPTIWAALARVLGAAVPYWPATLRQRDLIHAWQPGAEPVTALARSSIDSGPLLQLAATYPHGDNRALVLTNLAQKINHDAYRGAEFAVQRLTETELVEPEHLAIAAVPLEVPDADRDDISPVARRAAWRDIQARTDRLATTVMRLYSFVDGGSDLAAGSAYQINPGESPWALHWADRLQPCARTAAHNMLHDDPDSEALIDPETDAAVVRKHNGILVAAIPQRLPARAPLKELILHGPIWVRTADDTLWPAPRDSYFGLSWGYDGSGPGALALLIDHLLDDITSLGPADVNGAPPGLERLTATRLRAGTVLSRDDLLAARDNNFLPIFTTEDEPDEQDEDDR
jgi:hypothetical protein